MKQIKREMCHGCNGRGAVQLQQGRGAPNTCPFKGRAELPVWPMYRHCPVCLGMGWYEVGGWIWKSVRSG